MHSSSPGSNGNSAEAPRHFYQQSWVRYASLFMVFFIFIGFWLYSESLISSLESLRAELRQTRSALDRQRDLLTVLQSPDLSAYSLKGEDPNRYGLVLLDPSRNTAVIQFSNLPLARQDSSYQLWAVSHSRLVPVVSFVPDSTSSDRIWMTVALDSTIGRPDGFQVSLESLQRSNHPRHHIILRSDFPTR